MFATSIGLMALALYEYERTADKKQEDYRRKTRMIRRIRRAGLEDEKLDNYPMRSSRKIRLRKRRSSMTKRERRSKMIRR